MAIEWYCDIVMLATTHFIFDIHGDTLPKILRKLTKPKFKNYDYLNLFVHMEHLLSFSYFEISRYVDSPILEDFVEFSYSNMSQLDETSLDKIEILAVFIFFFHYGMLLFQ